MVLHIPAVTVLVSSSVILKLLFMSLIHTEYVWLITLYNFLYELTLWISSQISENARCCLRGTPKANHRPKKTRAFSPVYLSFYKWREVPGEFSFRGTETVWGISVSIWRTQKEMGYFTPLFGVIYGEMRFYNFASLFR